MATQTDSFGMSEEFIKAQQAKRAAGAFSKPSVPTQTPSTVNATPAPAPTVPTPSVTEAPQAPAPTPVPAPTPAPVQPVAPTPSVTQETVQTTDSFGMSPEFIKAQQEKRAAQEAKAPVAVATTTVKTPEQISQRKTEIDMNLNEGLKNAPQLFSDKATFLKAYGYGTKPAEEKAQLDAFWNNITTPKAPEDYITNILSGRAETNRDIISSTNYKEALNRANNVKMFANMTASEAAKAYNGGQMDTFAVSDMQKFYPEKYNSMITLSKLNGGQWTNVMAVENATTDTLLNTFSNLFNKNGVQTVKESLAANPEIQSLATQKNKYAEELTAINSQIDQVSDQVDEELKWKNASSTYAAALKASRAKALINQGKLAEARYNNAMTALADATKNAMYDIERQDKLDAEQRAIQQQMVMSVFNQKLSQASKRADFEEALRQKTMVATDPVLATSDVIDTYEKIGIIPMRSRAEIISDVQRKIASGQTLGQALTELNQAFQSKPEYKQYVAKQFPQEKDKFQAVNLGDGRYAAFNPATWTFTTGTAWTDFTNLATKYPWVAAFKNNNPAGITWNSNFAKWTWTAKALSDAGISYEIGTSRPSSEGGNYVKFASIEDGLAAQRIIMQKTYWNTTVGNMLASWVWTSEGPAYAKQVANSAWIDTNAKISDLSDAQISALQLAKINKESPGLYKELQSANIVSNALWTAPSVDKAKIPQYINYVEKGVLPTGLKDWTPKAEEFKNAAQAGYTQAKNSQYWESGFEITNPDAFSATSAKQKEDITTAIKQVQPFIASIDKLIKMVKENGTENPYSEVGKKMAAEVKNTQLIAKEIYNLGVLNWPDLSLMEAIIQNPTSAEANTLWSFQDYASLLENAKKTILDNATAQARSVGLNFKWSVWGVTNTSNQEQQTWPGATSKSWMNLGSDPLGLADLL